MKPRKLIAKKNMEVFYKEAENKRKCQKTKFQTDLEFRQKKKKEKKEVNKNYNVEMFPTVVRGGKAFAAEQKFRELNRPLEIKRSADKRIKPLKLPQNAVENISNLSSSKYKKKTKQGLVP